ncbi:MAG: GDP-mannose 4,6-dehydratase [Acidimicrobiia bacterium]|nr:GDP-mannose 4,6-dehydratase [Acidimicrobiia bacterium]
MTTYLVTGGAGFIGSHLTEALLARGDDVIVIDQLSTGRLENLAAVRSHPRFRFVKGSVLGELIVDELVSEADVVVHLAAAVGVKLLLDEPLHCLTQNIRGTEVVIDAANRYGRKVLIASTSEVYGKNGRGPLSEDSDRVLGAPTKSRWAYSTAKAVNEIMAYAYHRERGLDAVVVRFFNTVGPRQSPAYGMVIPRLVRQAVAGEPLTVYGDGAQSRCFCHVNDIVRAVTGLLDEPAAVGEVFNVGGAEEISILGLATRVKELAGSESPIVFVPYEQAYGAGFEDMRRREPDTTKVRQLLGWAPTATLDDILAETIAEARAERFALAADGDQR